MPYQLKLEKRPVVAFGPVMPDWGSWEWVGVDVAAALAKCLRVVTFSGLEVPTCEAAVVVKHSPCVEWLEQLRVRAGVVYCPVDCYGSPADIDNDAPVLRQCARILVHCERLRRYFEPYGPVEYIDHHIKYAAPVRETYLQNGYVLWVGVRTNLPPLAEWVNAHPLPRELRILTNPETPDQIPDPEEFGFRRGQAVRIDRWSKEAHLELLAGAKAALDIKGSDFRARHKPPAKAIDFIASGVPLAMNPDSSAAEHLARMGFEVASPLDTDRWFSPDYWEETRRFGMALRELLSLERIGRRYRRVIEEVLAERRQS
jgi:hypothetical protein